MRTIKLLKEYEGNQKGSLIQVTNNVAFGLVDSGVGAYPETVEFVKKTDMGKTKAFKSAPAEASVDNRPLTPPSDGGQKEEVTNESITNINDKDYE